MLFSTTPTSLNLHSVPLYTHLQVSTVLAAKPRRRKPPVSLFVTALSSVNSYNPTFKLKPFPPRSVLKRFCSDGGGGGTADATSQQNPANIEERNQNSPGFGEGYVGLFIRMLGLDNDPLDREQAIVALWKYSLGGKKCVDNIMQFQGCVNLTISVLKSQSNSTSEAAAGLLRSISSIDLYRDVVAESGAIEEITGLLSQSSLISEAVFLKAEVEEESKIIRKEARNALVEFAKNEYYRILIIEEGLVPVPLIGSAAYRTFTPALHSWPNFPDGTRIDRTLKGPSRFGASELLLGLNIDDNSTDVGEAKMKAIIGRSKQQFLARSGAIEVEDAKSSQTESSSKRKFTLLPWIDGVARLVLILELEDESAISIAAEAIADSSINEHMRNSFKEAGAVSHLVRLLDHHNDSIKLSVIVALERLSMSTHICRIIEAEGIVSSLCNILKNSHVSESMKEKALNLLARMLDPSKEMKEKLYDEPVNGSRKELDAAGGGATTIIDNTSLLNSNESQVVTDPVLIASLVGIMKSSSPHLQRNAASILEFVAISDASMDAILLSNIGSGLDAIFNQRMLSEMDSDFNIQHPELYALQTEEAGLAVSAASRLLTKLLDFEQFRNAINSSYFSTLLRQILKSSIPLHYKDWVAACLAKLGSYSSNVESESPINMEVILYETIPRLIEQMTSFSIEAQEAAVVELSRIISEGVVDATTTVASEGAIYPLVRLVEGGSERAVEAALSILYNLSMDNENHSAILAAGAVPVLRRIILAEKPQWKRALHLLRTLPT
ncbi:hypothetical protein K2173_010136 [Erythroxylum novogranatense]|uniref:ARM repeat superfamily protein n=1 Tax=Erythroxylum novogranatense TaxID=1862640 RepID=A0AAV8TSZ9_9ROSI|nr:hypothetical protein K2173_010136 [Erythroxylum novogranatense]